MPSDFSAFFHTATGYAPYAYQCRLACGEGARLDDDSTLGTGTECRSQLIEIPTGLGKTAAVVLAWLWNRVLQPDEDKRKTWLRRLVYCLPMRTLVEQTRDNVREWLKNLDDLEWQPGTSHQGKIGLHILMGGEDDGDWDIFPEREAILIGTQDMLLSRALNRGYGMSRYRWPMHFGLLNNDCLWVMDETQLMGPGLSTACQLEAFRTENATECSLKGFGSIHSDGSVTWYVSATANREHLKTRDWRGVTRPPDFLFGLREKEKAATSAEIYQRLSAAKTLEVHPGSSFGEKQPPEAIIDDILARHGEMLAALAQSPADSELARRTLIVCNTVDRAISVHAALKKAKQDGCDLLLLHSRFRPPERKAQMVRLGIPDPSTYPAGQIVVATQVIEAGLDLSSAILWSELAPLASLVQRLGRLNRGGEFAMSLWNPVAVIVGVGVEATSAKEKKEDQEEREKKNTKRCLPYELASIEIAWEGLRKLNGSASPANLERIQADIAASIPPCPYSLQRHELLDFFDTDANLSLGFTDVSPFVRGLDTETDLQVLWRDDWPERDGKPDFFPDYGRDELCPVPIGKALAHVTYWNTAGFGGERRADG